MGAVTGRVTDPAGAGIPGVWVYPTNGSRRVAGTHTGRDGTWRLDLPPGRWTVREVGHTTHDVLVPVDPDHDAPVPVTDTTRPGAPGRGDIAAVLARRRATRAAM